MTTRSSTWCRRPRRPEPRVFRLDRRQRARTSVKEASLSSAAAQIQSAPVNRHPGLDDHHRRDRGQLSCSDRKFCRGHGRRDRNCRCKRGCRDDYGERYQRLRPADDRWKRLHLWYQHVRGYGGDRKRLEQCNSETTSGSKQHMPFVGIMIGPNVEPSSPDGFTGQAVVNGNMVFGNDALSDKYSGKALRIDRKCL